MDKQFYKQLRKFAKRAIGSLDKYVDMDLLRFDHICYQTTSKQDYHDALSELKNDVEILAEIPHAGRMLTVVKLNSPISVDDIVIDRIEVSEPKPKRTVTKRNFDHISFTVKDKFDTFKDTLKQKGVKITEVKQIRKDRFFKFIEDDIEIELRNNRLGGDIPEPRKEDRNQHGEDNDTIDQLKAALSTEREAKLRALADYQNLQKRIDMESQRAGTDKTIALLSRLLDILDDFERAIANLKSEERDQVGLRMVYDKLRELVYNQGLEEIDCAVGDELNPHVHEAVGIIAIDGEQDDNTIQEVMQKGYCLKDNGQVVRSAKVIVGKRDTQ